MFPFVMCYDTMICVFDQTRNFIKMSMLYYQQASSMLDANVL